MPTNVRLHIEKIIRPYSEVCIVSGCTNKARHTIIKNIELRSKWLKAMKLTENQIALRARPKICQAHFKYTDYNSEVIELNGFQRLRLKRYAVPSIFPWQDQNTLKETESVLFPERVEESASLSDENEDEANINNNTIDPLSCFLDHKNQQGEDEEESFFKDNQESLRDLDKDNQESLRDLDTNSESSSDDWDFNISTVQKTYLRTEKKVFVPAPDLLVPINNIEDPLKIVDNVEQLNVTCKIESDDVNT